MGCMRIAASHLELILRCDLTQAPGFVKAASQTKSQSRLPVRTANPACQRQRRSVLRAGILLPPGEA
jgi:hypothetical protein